MSWFKNTAAKNNPNVCLVYERHSTPTTPVNSPYRTSAKADTKDNVMITEFVHKAEDIVVEFLDNQLRVMGTIEFKSKLCFQNLVFDKELMVYIPAYLAVIGYQRYSKPYVDVGDSNLNMFLEQASKNGFMSFENGDKFPYHAFYKARVISRAEKEFRVKYVRYEDLTVAMKEKELGFL